MSEVIILEDVSKKYRTGASHKSLVNALGSIRFFGGRRRSPSDLETQILWALKDVNFKVGDREILGFIGPNGAGKTTLLKILSGVTRPTTGQVITQGRISSLIELGAGFHPELTGRENIYLNGSILGLHRKEVDSRFDSIVAFSGLEPYLDTPVKRYSSGMYVRLGFSVAAHVDPDILLVDEVLAVGDHEFRAKCMERFTELRQQGITTIIVAHNRHLIEQMCTRVIYFDHGKLIFDGDPKSAWDLYLSKQANVSTIGDSARKRRPEIGIEAVRITGENGEERSSFIAGEPMKAEIKYTVNKKVHDPVFYARIFGDGRLLLGTNTARAKIEGSHYPGESGIATIAYKGINLLEGSYSLELGIEKNFHSRAEYDRAAAVPINVISGLENGTGLVYMDYRWTVKKDDGSQASVG